MKTAIAFASAVLLVPGTLAQLINTPSNVQQCRPTLLTWSGGQPPYILDLVPGGQTGAAPLQELAANTNDLSLTWKPIQPAGTVLGLNLRDNTGALVQSGPITILPGGDDSCLTSASGSSTVAVPSSTSTVVTTTTSGASTPASSSSAPSVTSALSSASSAASSASSVASSASSVASSIRSSASSAASSSSRSPSSSSPAPSATNSGSGVAGLAPAGFLGFVGAVVALVL